MESLLNFMQTSFIHLRVSSEFSISRGLLRINEIIENAKKLNMPAVALTDLNNMFGMVKFFKKAEAADRAAGSAAKGGRRAP